MKLSEIKEIMKRTEEWREVVQCIALRIADIHVGDGRFVKSECIDTVMCDDLESDLYILGCFSSNFLADVLDIDEDVIVALQQAEAFEAIGKLIISLGKLDELQQQAVRWDGYGYYFNHYDGTADELYFDDYSMYYFFRN